MEPVSFVSVEEVSFERLHRISSTDPNLELHTIKINGTVWKYFLRGFI